MHVFVNGGSRVGVREGNKALHLLLVGAVLGDCNYDQRDRCDAKNGRQRNHKGLVAAGT